MISKLKLILIPIVFFSILLAKINNGIHQRELEYYKKHYIGKQQPVYNSTKNRNQEVALSHEVFGYHPYWMNGQWQNYDFSLISTLAYFSLEAKADGNFSNLNGWPNYNLVGVAHLYGTKVVICVTLFNSSDIVTLLESELNRSNMIQNIINQIEAGNADGVNIDFESVPASQRSNMVLFITSLTEVLHQTNPSAQVTLATPAVDWSNAWDYNNLALISDGLFIMGYDYHWSGSQNTGPIAPLSGSGYNIEWTISDYLNKTNNQYNKLILGCPYYGYQWKSSSQEAGSITLENATAKRYSETKNMAIINGKIWDSSSSTPWLRYQESNWYQCWYDDSLSLSMKYDFALEKELKGIGMWALGYDEGQDELWNLIHEKFSSKSPPPTPKTISIKNIGDNKIKINLKEHQENENIIVLAERLQELNKFDTLGIYNQTPIFIEDLNQDQIYFIKIILSNDFGDSSPSELLGVIPSINPAKCIIINGFDRTINTNNTFDFIKQHGLALQKKNYSFDSATNESVTEKMVNLNDYQFTDWILGEEGSSSITFSLEEQSYIELFLNSGNFLFVSGSEIGYDLVGEGDEYDKDFYSNYLKSEYISDAAGGHQNTYTGYGVKGSIFEDLEEINFDNGLQNTYNVDWPDGIKPIKGSSLAFKYKNTSYEIDGGMGIQYLGKFSDSKLTGGLIYIAVGFETIYPESKRNLIMSKIIDFFYIQLNEVKIDRESLSPSSISINNIYPNPTNSSIISEFTFNKSDKKILINITDILGKTLKTASIISNGSKQQWKWNGNNNNNKNVGSGVYFISFRNKKEIKSKKITIIK